MSTTHDVIINVKIAKCLSQLGMEKRKNVKIAKCLSQFGMEKI